VLLDWAFRALILYRKTLGCPWWCPGPIIQHLCLYDQVNTTMRQAVAGRDLLDLLPGIPTLPPMYEAVMAQSIELLPGPASNALTSTSILPPSPPPAYEEATRLVEPIIISPDDDCRCDYCVELSAQATAGRNGEDRLFHPLRLPYPRRPSTPTDLWN